MDFNFLVLGDDSLAKVHADAAKKSIESYAVEGLAIERVLVGAETCRAAHSLTTIAEGQRALQPLAGIVRESIDDQFNTDVEDEEYCEILRPRMLPEPVQFDDSPHVGQLQQCGNNENNSNDSSSVHNFLLFKNCVRFVYSTAKVGRFVASCKNLGYSAGFCDEWFGGLRKMH